MPRGAVKLRSIRERNASTVDTRTHAHIYRFVSPPSLVLCSWSVLTGSTMETRLRMALWLQVHSLPLSWSLSSMYRLRSKTFPRSIRWKSELAFSLRGFPELRASRTRVLSVKSLSLFLAYGWREDLSLVESRWGAIWPVDLSFLLEERSNFQD